MRINQPVFFIIYCYAVLGFGTFVGLCDVSDDVSIKLKLDTEEGNIGERFDVILQIHNISNRSYLMSWATPWEISASLVVLDSNQKDVSRFIRYGDDDLQHPIVQASADEFLIDKNSSYYVCINLMRLIPISKAGKYSMKFGLHFTDFDIEKKKHIGKGATIYSNTVDFTLNDPERLVKPVLMPTTRSTTIPSAGEK